MGPDELEALAVKLGVVPAGLMELGDRIAAETRTTSQELRQTAHEAAAVSQRLTVQALEQFQYAGVERLGEALRDPVRQAGLALRDSIGRAEEAAAQLEARLRTVRRLNAVNAWRTFVASALASVVIIGVAVYAALQAHQDIARSDWIGQINAAVAAGTLAPCPSGVGICALVGNRWTMLAQ